MLRTPKATGWVDAALVKGSIALSEMSTLWSLGLGAIILTCLDSCQYD